MTQIMSTEMPEAGDIGKPPKLKRTVGFWGLSFVSLGSIICSAPSVWHKPPGELRY